MADKAFLVDTTKCIGCKACQVACKQWNNLPAEEKTESMSGFTNPGSLSAITFNHVICSRIESPVQNNPVSQTMHKKCFHCETPNCLTVCPADAVYKKDYWVLIDQENCIGCGECVRACIYGVPHLADRDYNEVGTGGFINKDKAYKCHACVQKEKEIPACVGICPSDALIFDYRLKIVAAAKKRVKTVKKDFPNAYIYGLEEFGGLHVITILKDAPEKFELDRNPQSVSQKTALNRKEFYDLLSKFSFNMPVLKRAIYKISKYLTS